MRKRILAVDDDPDIRQMVGDHFARSEFDLVTAANGAEMRTVLESGGVDLLILDVRMPGEDGFALAREIRRHSALPIIMLTAQDEEVDRVLGLELGADDYLTKPYSPRELLARVRAVLRRQELVLGLDAERRRAGATCYRFAGWELNTATRRLTSPANERVDLTNSEYLLLSTLLRAPRKVFTRDQLLDGSRAGTGAIDRSIDVHILRLRRKLESDPNDPALIRTERGVGYFLDTDVAAS